VRLGARTWREVHGAGPLIVAVPLGSCEQHGPHLPLDTDTRIAVALADGLAAARPDVVVAPPLSYGASGEHAGFAGTLSIGLDVMTTVVVELVRSADWAAGVVLVNGHGGNHRAITDASPPRRGPAVWRRQRPRHRPRRRRPRRPHRDVAPPRPGAVDRAPRGAQAGATEPLGQFPALAPAAWLGGPQRVLGDPAGQRCRGGRRAAALTDDLVAAVERWQATG
jgi:creatinine amidohydrolase